MWLFDRRQLLGLALAGLLGACGFTPVYAPGGGGQTLQSQLALNAPDSEAGFFFTQRFEERMGRGSAYDLTVQLGLDQTGLGGTSAGETTRYRITGRAVYTLTRPGTEGVVLDGWTEAFTGYSTTGSTVATRAAERDAIKRLMVILADQLIDALILQADTLAG